MLSQPGPGTLPGVFIDRLTVVAVTPGIGADRWQYTVTFTSGAQVVVDRETGNVLLAELAGK
jgi:hypothetical protein